MIRISEKTRTTLVIAAAACVLTVHLAITVKPGEVTDLSRIRTPVDRSSDPYDTMWLFLTEAQGHLPDGATYTIVANEPTTEMRIFMMSLGVMINQQGVPRRYYSRDLARLASGAEFVLVYGTDAEEQVADAELVATVDFGSILRRRPGPQ